MEATKMQAENPILNEMVKPKEIVVPSDLQSVLDKNRYAHTLASAELEILRLRQELLLKDRYIAVYEYALKTGINTNDYDIIDDLKGSTRFVLKEAHNDRSPSD